MATDEADQPASQAGLYPIRTVASLTGVNPVTLRAWERRYGLVIPQRTPKGHRLYTEDDIERIRRVLELLDHGIPIGQTLRLLEQHGLQREAPPPLTGGDALWDSALEQAGDAVRRFDATGLQRIYEQALALHALPRVCRLLIAPLAAQLFMEGANDRAIAERGFLGAFMCNKLGAALHHSPESTRGSKLLMAGLPAACCEIELMLYHLVAVNRGHRVAQIGDRTLPSALGGIAEAAQAQGIIIVGKALSQEAARGVENLAQRSAVPIFLAGGCAHQGHAAEASVGAQRLPDDVNEAIGRLQDHV